jgi:hypothetical protein
METVFEIVSKISTPLILAGVVVLSLFFVFREIIRKDIFPKLTKKLSFEVIRILLRYLFILGFVSIVLGFAGYIIQVRSSSSRVAAYRVRAMMIDHQNLPVDGTEIIISPEGFQNPIKGGWQIDINPASVPADRKLTIWATKDNGILKGSAEYVLGDDYNPTVFVKLQKDDSAKVIGQVNDSKGQPLSGAVVYINGYQYEKVTTSETGLFELPAHAAGNEHVHLFVQKPGYVPWNDMVPAGGNTLARIMLTKVE